MTGKIEISMKTPLGTNTVTVDFDAMTWTDSNGATELMNFSEDGGNVKFSAKVKTPLGKQDMSLNLTIADGAVTGKAKMALGAMDVTGKVLSSGGSDMAEKLIDSLDKIKAYPQVDIVDGLLHKKDYQLNSWFYIGRGKAGGEDIIFLSHQIYYQFPGQAAMMVASLTFSNLNTGEHSFDTQVFTADQTVFDLEKYSVKCPVCEMGGDLGQMHVRHEAPIGSVDCTMIPMGTPLFNMNTGRYFMLDLDIHQYALPTMEAKAKLKIGDKEYDWEGNCWLDRQWQIDISGIDPENPPEMDLTVIPTWGWYSITLDSGEKLSVWFPKDPAQGWKSWCTILHPDGAHTVAYVENIFATADNWFHHEDSLLTYATKYTLKIPQFDAELVITADPIDQEIRNEVIPVFSYYEGACKVEGTFKGKPASGVAFLEMIGAWIKEML